MKKLTFSLLFFMASAWMMAQPLVAYHDYRGYFTVFDNGTTKAVEYLPVKSYKVGETCIPYVDNANQFKVYYKGKVQLLSEVQVTYIVTRHLLVYFKYNQLYVFDNGEKKMLSSDVKNFAIGDSIVIFYNENTHSTNAYYDGQIVELDRSLAGTPIKNFSAGDNIGAYFNPNSKYFKVFYNGELEEVMHSDNTVLFEAGRNIVAYVDDSQDSFHAYYMGEIIDLEDFRPKSFKVGDDMVAYVDNLGNFKVFVNDEVQTISSFQPESYLVKDGLVVFTELGHFKVFYDEEVYDLENYVPKDFQINGNTIAFIGLNGWLKAFIDGEYITVTNDLVKMFELTYNLIFVNTTVNKVKIFYKENLK